MFGLVEGLLTQEQITAVDAVLGNYTPSSGVQDYSALSTEILSNQQNTYDTVYRSSVENSNALNTYGLILSRNTSLKDAADNMTTVNNRATSALEAETTTSTRQVEINNWQYENKMDTLFFLQLLFIFMCAAAILLFLRHSMMLSAFTTYLFIGILTLIMLIVLWNRWSYTTRTRDKKYWNRKRIAADGNLDASMKCS
jgi:hypothetical protein